MAGIGCHARIDTRPSHFTTSTELRPDSPEPPVERSFGRMGATLAKQIPFYAEEPRPPVVSSFWGFVKVWLRAAKSLAAFFTTPRTRRVASSLSSLLLLRCALFLTGPALAAL